MLITGGGSTASPPQDHSSSFFSFPLNVCFHPPTTTATATLFPLSSAQFAPLFGGASDALQFYLFISVPHFHIHCPSRSLTAFFKVSASSVYLLSFFLVFLSFLSSFLFFRPHFPQCPRPCRFSMPIAARLRTSCPCCSALRRAFLGPIFCMSPPLRLPFFYSIFTFCSRMPCPCSLFLLRLLFSLPSLIHGCSIVSQSSSSPQLVDRDRDGARLQAQACCSCRARGFTPTVRAFEAAWNSSITDIACVSSTDRRG